MSLLLWCNKIIVVILGLLLGFLTLLPNVMMADRGTSCVQIASSIGLVASFSLAIGGIVACVRAETSNKYAGS